MNQRRPEGNGRLQVLQRLAVDLGVAGVVGDLAAEAFQRGRVEVAHFLRGHAGPELAFRDVPAGHGQGVGWLWTCGLPGEMRAAGLPSVLS